MQILLSIQSDREWRSLCRHFLDEPELGENPNFSTNVSRVSRRDETDARVAEGFARRDEEEAIAALLVANVAFAKVNDMAGLSSHPHLRRIAIETPGGTVNLPAPAPVWDDDEVRHYGPVPQLNPREA